MLHPPPTPNQSVSRRPSFKLTTPNMLPSTWSATGSSACTRWITKSHSSPVHVNETQAPLWSSKALLSADSYHLPLASERVMARQGYSGDEELLFHFVSITQSHYLSKLGVWSKIFNAALAQSNHFAGNLFDRLYYCSVYTDVNQMLKWLF